MKKKIRKERGLLSLEASIALTIFIFMMLFLYSFFVVFEARNQMGHAVLSTANSLSLDAYMNDTVGNSGTVAQILYNVYGEITNDYSDFTDHTGWYNLASDHDDFLEVIKNRFIAYVTAGDVANAEEILARYHIKGGVDGLDFSGSYVENDRLFFKVRYTLEYEYNAFGLGEVEMEQSACSKLWK